MAKFPLLAAMLSLAVPGAAAASGGGGETPHLVAMDEIRVPIIEGNRSDGTLRLKLVLQTKTAAGAEHAKAMLPVLRASSLGAAVEFARLYVSPMRPVDAGRLAADMTAALHAQDADIARVLLVEVIAVRR